MDNTALGLSIAIAIVIILLLTCWGSPQEKNKSKKRCVYEDIERSSLDVPRQSQYGTGVKNREFDARFNSLKNLDSYDDYNAVATYMSLEPEVFESHARYSRDMSRSTTGASMMTVRDDPNDPVKWVGRPPQYRGVTVGYNARELPSDIPDQLRQRTFYPI